MSGNGASPACHGPGGALDHRPVGADVDPAVIGVPHDDQVVGAELHAVAATLVDRVIAADGVGMRLAEPFEAATALLQQDPTLWAARTPFGCWPTREE